MILDSLIAFLFLLFLGYGAGYLRVLNRVHVDGVLRYIQFVAIPLMILVKVMSVESFVFSWEPFLVYYLPTIFLFFATFFIGKHWLNLSVRNSGVLAFGSTFSNLILLGFPVLSLFFNDHQLINYFSILSVHALLLQVLLFLSQAYNRSMSWVTFWKKVKWILRASPIISALILGNVLREFGVSLPSFFEQTGRMLEGGVSAAALVSIGVLLSAFKNSSFLYVGTITSFFKLCIHPLLVLLTGYLFGMSFSELKLFVLMAAFPSGVVTAIVSRSYSASSGFSSSIVSLSVALSVLSLSLVIYLLFDLNIIDE